MVEGILREGYEHFFGQTSFDRWRVGALPEEVPGIIVGIPFCFFQHFSLLNVRRPWDFFNCVKSDLGADNDNSTYSVNGTHSTNSTNSAVSSNSANSTNSTASSNST